MKRALILSNGEYSDYDFYREKINRNDFIICADGAIEHCICMNIIPDVWIGDFDSCCKKESEYDIDLSATRIVKLNPVKDETDTHCACKIALECGCDEIVIWGGFGKRLDHMFANVALLEYLDGENVGARLENEKNTITFVKDEIVLEKKRKYLSIIPLDAAIRVKKTDGLVYALENELLFRNESRAVSNEFCSDRARITLSDGRALIIESDD